MKKNVTIYTTVGDEIRTSMTEEQLKELISNVPYGMDLEIENTEYYIMPDQVVRIDVENINKVNENLFHPNDPIHKMREEYLKSIQTSTSI